jgi:uncharacterized protein (DUF1697 family)
MRTYLQSGNVVFDSLNKDSGQMSTIIGEEISRRFGIPLKVIVRTPEDFRLFIADNPLATGGLQSSYWFYQDRNSFIMADLVLLPIRRFLAIEESALRLSKICHNKIFIMCKDN